MMAMQGAVMPTSFKAKTIKWRTALSNAPEVRPRGGRMVNEMKRK
jgi:hypothetical protein